MERIPVVEGGVSVHAYGVGGTVSALYVCATVADTLKLKAAIEALVQEAPALPSPMKEVDS